MFEDSWHIGYINCSAAVNHYGNANYLQCFSDGKSIVLPFDTDVFAYNTSQ